MERIQERKMTQYVLGLILINVGLSIVYWLVGLILGAVIDGGGGALVTGSTFYGVFGILSLFSMNIYNVYFYYRLSMDVNAMCEGDGQESESFLMAVVLGTVTFGLYRLYWVYKLAQRMKANSPRYGYTMLEGGKDILILDLFSMGYFSTYELIKNSNRFASTYNRLGLPKFVSDKKNTIGMYKTGGDR